MTALRKTVTYIRHDPYALVRDRKTRELAAEVERIKLAARDAALDKWLEEQVAEELAGFDPLTGGLI